MDPSKEKIQTEQDPKTTIKSLRTYQGDVEEAILKNNYSASTILIAEEKRKREEEIRDPNSIKNSDAKNKLFVFVGMLLLILGALTVVYVFYIKSRNEIVVTQKTKTLISFSQEKLVPITNREILVTSVLDEKQAFNLPVNSVLYINIVNESGKEAEIEKFLSLVTPKMPPSLSRSFSGEYMLGMYSFGANEPFIILKTNDYANSFSGMLKWETDIVSDLGKMFSINLNTASSSIEFRDETLKNKDLRILKNENQKTVLLYSFIDKETLVITTDENILTAIIGKYNISQQIR